MVITVIHRGTSKHCGAPARKQVRAGPAVNPLTECGSARAAGPLAVCVWRHTHMPTASELLPARVGAGGCTDAASWLPGTTVFCKHVMVTTGVWSAAGGKQECVCYAAASRIASPTISQSRGVAAVTARRCSASPDGGIRDGVGARRQAEGGAARRRCRCHFFCAKFEGGAGAHKEARRLPRTAASGCWPAGGRPRPIGTGRRGLLRMAPSAPAACCAHRLVSRWSY
jgi:hypothetical protein